MRSAAPELQAMDGPDNANPVVYAVGKKRDLRWVDIADLLTEAESDDDFDESEIFEYIRHLNDPEHPYSLEELKVIELKDVQYIPSKKRVFIQFTPTIKHCSQATLIGLMIRVKLLRCLPSWMKVEVKITPGAHDSEDAVNKQLNDKERVAAALENPSLIAVINRGIANTDRWHSIIADQF
eukprot:GDKH01028598.1.p1 GENE.GDKH01028598.1~~GDKH01028598.1.p1  ORF type:complete len:181 (+),score=23.54 GDKH01028598.1:109-651(+)